MHLDAVKTRAAAETASGTGKGCKSKINIRIDLDDNSLTVSDNGIGLDKEKFEHFADQVPDSCVSGITRDSSCDSG